MNKKVFNDPKPVNAEKLEQKLEDFNQLMLRYENLLNAKAYLTGNKMTWIDVLIFIEIETVLIMYRIELPSRCRKLLRWQDKLSQEPSIKTVNSEFLKLVQDWDLYAPNK